MEIDCYDFILSKEDEFIITARINNNIMVRCLLSDPAGSRELVPSRLFSLRGVLQGSGWGAFHCGPPEQHLLRGRLQQVRLKTKRCVTICVNV